MMKVNNIRINNEVYKNFYSSENISILQYSQNDSKDKYPTKGNKKISLPVIITTITGTLIPILIIRKYQEKALKLASLKDMDFISKTKSILKSFNIEYGLKEMLFTSFGSITGGLSGGILFNKDENKKSKIKEAVFQFINIAVPTSIVAGLLKLTDKRNLKGVFPKIASVILGIGAGMPIAAALSNKINNTLIDKENTSKRKLCIKDCFVHIDDLIGALILAKIPFADKLHADKILPVLYGMCGYEAGTKK